MKTEFDLSEAVLKDSFSFTGGIQHFPYEIDMGGIYCCGASYYTKRECFSHSILLYTLSGCGRYEYRGKAGLLPAGTVLLLDSKFSHYYGSAEDMSWKFIWMHYEDRGNCSLADYFFETGMEIQQIPEEAAWKFYDSIKDFSRGLTSLCELRAMQEFLQFLSDWGFHNIQSSYPVIRESGGIVTEAQLYMQENYRKKISLQELAYVCAVNQYHLIRLFRKYVGVTPYQYLLRVRISRAKLLLVSTDKTVSQIGEEVGFEDDSTFIAAFRKLTGATPLRYRKWK